MKLTKNTNFRIAKGILDDIFTKTEPLDYDKWVGFVENYSDYFIWNENTEEGKKSLQNIENVPEDFKERVLASLNKVRCFAEFSDFKKLYDISVSFYGDLNWITIQYASTPKLEDLKIFVEMAKHLDALLLKDGKEIIDEKMIESLT
jgi:hypothetical protein